MRYERKVLIFVTEGDAASMTEMSGASPEGSSRKLREEGVGASSSTADGKASGSGTTMLMEAVVCSETMRAAYKRVVSNKGAAGVDGMPVDALKAHLQATWLHTKEALLSDRYKPSPVRVVEIAKPGGGVRRLGIPTVQDRLIQQALLQVLSPIFEPLFSAQSYGFRPGRRAHDAVLQAQAYVAEGYVWVVDLDLESFFDRVNHDMLMARVAKRVEDKRVLRLIRRYLQTGILRDGLTTVRTEGTPQGGPLSPLLSNILLDDLDKELERRGHRFCRYADDCNVYVKSRTAGERVRASLTAFLEKRLKLKVNAAKSGVDRAFRRDFLGYGMTHEKQPRLKVASSAQRRFRVKLRKVFKQARGKNLKTTIAELRPILAGWMQYYRLAQVKNVFGRLDEWLRRKLRCILWRQWKRPFARAKHLTKRGLPEEQAWRSAYNGRGPWWNAGATHMNLALPKAFFAALGLVSLLNQHLRFQAAS